MNVSVVAGIAIGGLGWVNFLKFTMLLLPLLSLLLASPILKQPLVSIRSAIEKETSG
jgi:hypothetical protein